jgi:hypothetical protein
MKLFYLQAALVSAALLSVCAQAQRLGHKRMVEAATDPAMDQGGSVATSGKEENGAVDKAKDLRQYKSFVWSAEDEDGAVEGAYNDRIVTLQADLTRNLARSSSSPGCETMKIKWYNDKVNVTETSYGLNIDIPIHLRETGELIARYQSSHMFHKDSDCECDVIGTATFYKDGRLSGSQIRFMATCCSPYYSIVGGTGKYECAMGSLRVYEKEGRAYDFGELHICGAGCSLFK